MTRSVWRRKGRPDGFCPGRTCSKKGNDAVLASYKIAVKEPDLLAKFHCYCFGEGMGHKNLTYCFLKQSKPGQFDEHASGCNTCDAEAMQVFLWNELGVPTTRMAQGLKQIYSQ